MSWEELLPDVALKPGTSPVSVTINKLSGRFKQRMILTIRVKALDSISTWCKPGAPVEVQVGVGSDAGGYRLRPVGPWKFRNSAGHIKAVSISLPAPRGAPGGGCKQTPVVFHVDRDQLQFALPAWGLTAPTPKASVAAPPPAERRPHLGICERVPDPAKAIQAANGARVR